MRKGDVYCHQTEYNKTQTKKNVDSKFMLCQSKSVFERQELGERYFHETDLFSVELAIIANEIMFVIIA
jgi:hypothetical protein